VVSHLSLPLMNSFNKTEAAVFSFRPCFLRASLSSVFLKETLPNCCCIDIFCKLFRTITPERNCTGILEVRKEREKDSEDYPCNMTLGQK